MRRITAKSWLQVEDQILVSSVLRQIIKDPKYQIHSIEDVISRNRPSPEIKRLIDRIPREVNIDDVKWHTIAQELSSKTQLECRERFLKLVYKNASRPTVDTSASKPIFNQQQQQQKDPLRNDLLAIVKKQSDRIRMQSEWTVDEESRLRFVMGIYRTPSLLRQHPQLWPKRFIRDQTQSEALIKGHAIDWHKVATAVGSRSIFECQWKWDAISRQKRKVDNI